MRRVLKISLFALIILFATIQLIRPSRTNPPVDPAREVTAVHPADPVVTAAIQRSCNDCHSNRTAWPWYSNVAPASWLVVHDVNSGRSSLNFSEWSSYTPEKQHKLTSKICEEAREGEMPVLQYTFAHPNARLTGPEVTALCSWTQQVAQNTGGAKETEKEDKDDD